MDASRQTARQIGSLEDLRAHVPTGNAAPLLSEIAAALARLIDTGQPTTIDLGALPFSAGDERALEAALGPGEVHATIDALGQSHVSETGTAGVWRVDHFDANGETLSRFVEITFVPDILTTQPADAAAALGRLRAALAEEEGR